MPGALQLLKALLSLGHDDCPTLACSRRRRLKHPRVSPRDDAADATQKVARTDNWNLRGAPDETGRPKRGEPTVPTKVL